MQALIASLTHQSPSLQPIYNSSNNLPQSAVQTVTSQQSSLTLPYIPAVTTLIPGLRSTVGMTDFSALCTVVGVQSTSIKYALDGEYIPMESSLLNLHFASENAADLQTYVDNVGYVGYKPKHQKRKITCHGDWLEAFTNYEQTMLNYHKGWNLHKSMSDYRTLITKYEKRYHWNAVQAFDMQHRATLSRKSVNFMKVDFTLQVQVLDATEIKTVAPKCHRCRSFDHHVRECPFLVPHPQIMQAKNTWQSKPKINNAKEVCRNFNQLRCVFRDCIRSHICFSFGGDLPHLLCFKQGTCATTQSPPTSSI